MATEKIRLADILDDGNRGLYDVVTHAPGPQGELPLTEPLLREAPTGRLFGMSQAAGMGWNVAEVDRTAFLILSTQGGLRRPDGEAVALGLHSGHWELDALVETAARQFRELGCIPHAAACTDPCDGRTQGTPGMMDSLAYRNDAATVFRRLIRSLPSRAGVLGIATCDKGLPAMMMALVAMRDLPSVLAPGGVTLPPTKGEDLGTIQSISARFAQGEVSLDYARTMTCRACASAGGGCQFLGTAATSQVVAEALGLTLPHAALAPSGQAIWRDMARRSAMALVRLADRGQTCGMVVTDASIHNAMVLHAAFGGSTNLLLHIPAIAHAGGLTRPALEDWERVNRQVPRLVDCLPNGPVGHPTVRVFLAGGVPEVMLHLRQLGLLALDARTVCGWSLDEMLNWWKNCERRKRLRAVLSEKDGVDPDDVILPVCLAKARGLTGTMTLPRGNLAPQGAVVKSTAIDVSLVDAEGVYHMTGPARVFTTEQAAFEAIKAGRIKPGDVMVLICAGPLGSGMEETLEVTGALKHVSWGKDVAVITDGRFSGVSTGACVGHVGPEALAGGPIAKVLDGDIIRIVIDRETLKGSIDLIGTAETPPERRDAATGAEILRNRPVRPDLRARPDLPNDTRLWAALQQIGGGTWGGCVFDVDAIVTLLEKDRQAQ